MLQVPSAWIEPGADQGETAVALAAELHRLAGWLGLSAVAAPERGDLAGPLARRAGGGRRRCTVTAPNSGRSGDDAA